LIAGRRRLRRGLMTSPNITWPWAASPGEAAHASNINERNRA